MYRPLTFGSGDMTPSPTLSPHEMPLSARGFSWLGNALFSLMAVETHQKPQRVSDEVYRASCEKLGWYADADEHGEHPVICGDDLFYDAEMPSEGLNPVQKGADVFYDAELEASDLKSKLSEIYEQTKGDVAHTDESMLYLQLAQHADGLGASLMRSQGIVKNNPHNSYAAQQYRQIQEAHSADALPILLPTVISKEADSSNSSTLDPTSYIDDDKGMCPVGDEPIPVHSGAMRSTSANPLTIASQAIQEIVDQAKTKAQTFRVAPEDPSRVPYTAVFVQDEGQQTAVLQVKMTQQSVTPSTGPVVVQLQGTTQCVQVQKLKSTLVPCDVSDSGQVVQLSHQGSVVTYKYKENKYQMGSLVLIYAQPYLIDDVILSCVTAKNNTNLVILSPCLDDERQRFVLKGVRSVFAAGNFWRFQALNSELCVTWSFDVNKKSKTAVLEVCSLDRIFQRNYPPTDQNSWPSRHKKYADLTNNIQFVNRRVISGSQCLSVAGDTPKEGAAFNWVSCLDERPSLIFNRISNHMDSVDNGLPQLVYVARGGMAHSIYCLDADHIDNKTTTAILTSCDGTSQYNATYLTDQYQIKRGTRCLQWNQGEQHNLTWAPCHKPDAAAAENQTIFFLFRGWLIVGDSHTLDNNFQLAAVVPNMARFYKGYLADNLSMAYHWLSPARNYTDNDLPKYVYDKYGLSIAAGYQLDDYEKNALKSGGCVGGAVLLASVLYLTRTHWLPCLRKPEAAEALAGRPRAEPGHDAALPAEQDPLLPLPCVVLAARDPLVLAQVEQLLSQPGCVVALTQFCKPHAVNDALLKNAAIILVEQGCVVTESSGLINETAFQAKLEALSKTALLRDRYRTAATGLLSAALAIGPNVALSALPVVGTLWHLVRVGIVPMCFYPIITGTLQRAGAQNGVATSRLDVPAYAVQQLGVQLVNLVGVEAISAGQVDCSPPTLLQQRSEHDVGAFAPFAFKRTAAPPTTLAPSTSEFPTLAPTHVSATDSLLPTHGSASTGEEVLSLEEMLPMLCQLVGLGASVATEALKYSLAPDRGVVDPADWEGTRQRIQALTESGPRATVGYVKNMMCDFMQACQPINQSMHRHAVSMPLAFALLIELIAVTPVFRCLPGLQLAINSLCLFYTGRAILTPDIRTALREGVVERCRRRSDQVAIEMNDLAGSGGGHA